MRLHVADFASPLGTITLVLDEGGVLRSLDFSDYDERMRSLLQRHYGAVDLKPGLAPGAVTAPLAAYFDGDYAALQHIRFATNGTSFQQSVWGILCRIPVGTTRSYGHIAAEMGKPGSSRAVGMANGANPISIVVPCHRVIGGDGSLTGFGGGLHRKRWLLEHERALTRSNQADLI